MHYKTKKQRHDNIIKARVTDEQLIELYAYAQKHDLPLATAFRELAVTNSKLHHNNGMLNGVIKGAESACN